MNMWMIWRYFYFRKPPDALIHAENQALNHGIGWRKPHVSKPMPVVVGSPCRRYEPIHVAEQRGGGAHRRHVWGDGLPGPLSVPLHGRWGVRSSHDLMAIFTGQMMGFTSICGVWQSTFLDASIYSELASLENFELCLRCCQQNHPKLSPILSTIQRHSKK